MSMTYEIAFDNFRNRVNIKFLVLPITPYRIRRDIQKIRTFFRGRGARGRAFEQRTFNGRHNHDRNGDRRPNLTHKRQDSSLITLTHGSIVDYHSSFKFPNDVFSKFKQEDKQ